MPLLGGPVAQRFDALANTSTPALPEVLAGRYRVGRDWAVAGSRSYLARDEKHGRDVAIKVIKQDLAASLASVRLVRMGSES